MKLDFDARSGLLVDACNLDHLVIAGRRYNCALVVTPSAIYEGLLPDRFAELRNTHLCAIVALEISVLIIGTGRRQLFLESAVSAELGAQGIGVETMTTSAACRSYNILANDKRSVAAALFID